MYSSTSTNIVTMFSKDIFIHASSNYGKTRRRGDKEKGNKMRIRRREVRSRWLLAVDGYLAPAVVRPASYEGVEDVTWAEGAASITMTKQLVLWGYVT